MNEKFYRSYIIAICLALPILSCSKQPATNTAQPMAEPTAVRSDALRIRGVLVKKNGSALKGKTVIAYPLDARGSAIIVNFVDEQSLWNPKTQTDAEGSFMISVPRVIRIGEDSVSEVCLGLDEPPGGRVNVTVVSIQYANQNKKTDFGFARKSDELSILRQGDEIVRVKFDEQADEVNLGKIVIDY